MMQAKNIFSYSKGNALPLYQHYPLQQYPQPAFITLNVATGEVDADYTGDIGNAIPEPVWQRRILRFTISACTPAQKVHDLIERHLDAFQTILNGAEIAWINSNQVGQFTDEACTLIEQLHLKLSDESELQAVTVIDGVEDICLYFDDNELFFNPNQDPLSYAQELIDSVNPEKAHLSANVDQDASMLSTLCELWCEILYRGDELPQHVAQHLLDNGDCEDSAWMEELRSMVKGKPL